MHDAATSMPPQAPSTWADYLAGYRWRGQGEGCSAATVHRLEAARRPTLFVKQEVLSAHAELPAEIARLRWLHGAGIDCPPVLNATQSDGRQWLLMRAVPGDTLPALAQRGELEPERLVRLVAAALRRLHDLDPAACPFDHRLERRLDTVRQRVEAGLVDEADFDDDHRGRSATELYRLLLDRRPAVEDLVVAHGDACLPNLLAEGRRFSGFIDCGRLGVADRHQALARAARDIEAERGAAWAEAFLVEYGGDIDGERLAYFRLLDEFF
ncbi:APH(3')-II family aminoglycoside O-phosphotransferase [Pseudomonas aeruginosa]|nr:APH(3')-II family aminoglycoside O-phosphotransferase [Pseudomonas aeruginosa]